VLEESHWGHVAHLYILYAQTISIYSSTLETLSVSICLSLQSFAVTSRFTTFSLNTSCLAVILQVTGRDGMSTLQNGAAAYSQSHIFASVVFHCLPCGFHLPECSPLMSGPPKLQRLSSDFTVFSQLPMQTLRAQPVRNYRVTRT